MGKAKSDCFAYHGGSCIALKSLHCAKSDCRFYKTHQQHLEDRRKAALRHKEIGLFRVRAEK